MSVHFNVNPPMSNLDFQQFSIKTREHFENHEYIFPDIKRAGNIDTIATEPEKVWFYSKDETKLLQLGRDRMVYNWKAGETHPVIYPKYGNIQPEFLKYWNVLSNYISGYKERKLNIKMCELYYSNVLHIGETQFLKNDRDLYKALTFISPYPENYPTVMPHINLQIPVDRDILFLRIEKIRDKKKNSEAFLLVLSIKNNKNLEDIDKYWYDKANQNIRQFFEKITTDKIRNFWKGKSNDTF